MADHSVKLILTRDQRRTIDRAAKASGLKTGPWARSELLKLAQVSGVVQTLQAAPKSAPVPVCRLCGAAPSSKHKPHCPAASAPLIGTFDPDAPSTSG